MEQARLESPKQQKNCTVLVAEDNIADIFVMKAALADWFEADPPTFSLDLRFVPEGAAALAYLAGSFGAENRYKDMPPPDLIILNINMPVMGGQEALLQIKQHPDWQQIPTVMYSTSNQRTSIAAALRAHANAYLTKCLDIQEETLHLKRTFEFFLGTASLVSVKALSASGEM